LGNRPSKRLRMENRKPHKTVFLMPADVRELIRELRSQGITDERVLDAIANTPRERFLPERLQSAAYENRALPIDCEQTISQPYIVALMTEALQLTGDAHVLEIGTGSGYQTAILAQLCGEVYTVERWPELARPARELLSELGFSNISYFAGDGTLGLKKYAPYDGIIVTAAAPQIPSSYWEQLNLDGRLVMPVGEEDSQELSRYRKTVDGWQTERLCSCRFVKLIGRHGWPANAEQPPESLESE